MRVFGGLGFVSLVVQCQVVTAGKAPVTHLTAEGFCPRVFANMTCEFVRSGKSPLAVWEMAAVGFFTCKDNKK